MDLLLKKMFYYVVPNIIMMQSKRHLILFKIIQNHKFSGTFKSNEMKFL